MTIIWQELTAGLPDAEQLLRMSLRLIMAMLLGAIIGYERERIKKPAGLRTHMLVSMGSALLVLVPLRAGASLDDTTRVTQGVATGIGFIGAGSILKISEQHQINGLTTAAGIWVTAAIGLAAGLGQIGIAILATLCTWLVLRLVTVIDKWMHHNSKSEPVNPSSDATHDT